jgi:hypothetical protein
MRLRWIGPTDELSLERACFRASTDGVPVSVQGVRESGSAKITVHRLPLAERRAVGGPVSRGLLGAYFAVALAGWLAATAAAVVAADDLAAGQPLASAPVLAVHLLALGVLPFAVSGASFHLLPVMLRNELPSQRALWVALPLLAGGLLIAAGLGREAEPVVWVGAAMVACGLAIVLFEVLTLVVRAPRGRMLVASRLGVSLSCAHVIAALCLGALIFAHDTPFGGLSHGRWLLIHLHVALIGWIALLILTVGRNLVPMLAMAPAAPQRAWPLEELALVAGLWVLLIGIGTRERALTVAGAIAVAAAIGRFGALVARVTRARRGPLEAPLVHLLVSGFFLAQAAGFGIAVAAGADGTRLVSGYVVLLLAGWAGGVVVGHIGKLLSLSLWVWWPPGPRPKQAQLYARRLGLAEAGAFAVGVETLAVGVFVGSASAAQTGAVVLCASAVLTTLGAASTWRRRSLAPTDELSRQAGVG